MNIVLAISVLLNISSAAVPNPVESAFDSKLPMETRWDLYHKSLKSNPKGSYNMAKKAIVSKDWFLREAGLKTYMALDPVKARNFARELLQNDPSLLVRTSALNAIRILNDKSSESILWKSLNDPKNFRGDQSLWIRPKIVSTLLDFKMVSKSQFEGLKKDKDPQIVQMAEKALSR